jgi:hypothetical protein
MADTALRSQITYKRFDTQEYSNALGYEVNSYTEYSLDAIRLSHTQASNLVGVGTIEIGSQLYLLKGDDAPTGMSLKDEIVDEFNELQKVSNITPIFGLAVAVTIEGGAYDAG